jgi:hypothetical protein
MEPEKEPENASEAEPAVADKRARASLLLKQFLKQLLNLQSLFQSWMSRFVALPAGIMQRLRGRFGKAPQEPAINEDEQREEGRRGKQRGSEDPEAEKAESPKAHAPPVRHVYFYLLTLLIGGFAGMAFSFSLFSRIIFSQADRIDALHGDNIVLEQENTRSRQAEVNNHNEFVETRSELLDTRRELTQTQKKLDESEGDLRSCTQSSARKNSSARFSPAHPSAQGEASGTAFPEYKAGSSSAPASRGSDATKNQPKSKDVAQKSGTCDITTGNVEGTLANCIKALKPEER